MSPKFIPGPHPAVIPMLLAMSQDQLDLEKTLDDLMQLLQSTKNAVQAMRSGMETFHAGMVKVAYPSSGQDGSPVSEPPEVPAKPVKEFDPIKDS